MTAPPSLNENLSNGMGAVRHALEDVLLHAPEAARQEAQQVLGSDELVQRVVRIVDDRFRRKHFRQIIWAVGGLLTVIMLLAGFGYAKLSADAATVSARFSDQDSALQRSQDTIAAFQAQLDASNAKLISQGLAPVAGPSGTIEPGSVDQAKLINAAATASTLAQLPEQITTQIPTKDLADAAAKAVADYFATNPIVQPGLTPQAVIDGVAAYLKDNPLPPGPKGDKGDQGLPPTAAQITEAFTAALQDNPQILCPAGGTYSSKIVMLAGGATAAQYGCWGDVTPPVTTTTPSPAPTTTPPGDVGVPDNGVTTTPPSVTPPEPPAPTTEAPVPTDIGIP